MENAKKEFEAALSALDCLSPYRSTLAQYEAAVDRLAAAEQGYKKACQDAGIYYDDGEDKVET